MELLRGILGSKPLLVIAYALLAVYSPHSKLRIGICYFAIFLADIGYYPINPVPAHGVAITLLHRPNEVSALPT